jgi:hypothetical protein
MKKILILLISISFTSFGLFAQNNENKADDAARISITPQVSDKSIPAGAQKMLLNKMKQIATKNGMAGDGKNPFFIMDASVDVLSKEITATAPPMTAISMQINFTIKGADGNVYSETSYTTKGVGKNETKAYIGGIKNISTSRGQFKAFVEKGKTKIIEYYNSQCDFVISKGKALAKEGRNDQAIITLQSVPPVCKECYDMCMEAMAEIKPSDKFVEPGTVVATNKTTTEKKDTVKSSTIDNSTGAAVTVSLSNIATMAKYPNAKTTYTKTLKYSTFYLPIDKLGNWTFGNKQTSVNGMITRYQFEVSGDNNPDFLLKITEPILQVLGFTVVVAKNNDQITSHMFRDYKNNSKLGGRYDIPWDNNCSYLFAKGKQNGKDVYLSIFFMEFNDKTIIIQDYVLSE